LALDRNLSEAYAVIGLAKIFIGRGEETETHVQEALRFSPRDTYAHAWTAYAGFAKLYLGSDEEAVARLRRAIEINRNYPLAHFMLAAALTNLGRLEEARARPKPGLPSIALSPFTASAPAQRVTTRPIWLNASGSMRACERPGCQRDERQPPAYRDLAPEKRVAVSWGG